ncbi:phospholipase D-like domain-containing protein [Paenibacillus polymyxa]|uniref:phospholipase D-like domain-containing protein n=1 Tax=Paenibacillus polymyxa TaxID=1406 RepID=UPI0020259616|nr:phospholipase D-like domain-containing protein [Paenibacillus polymyxa]URJ59011.3 phospholipase D-like domain-containing protein [Paenibacillus polymyxa]
MRIEELAEKYSTLYSDHELIHFTEVAFPVWRVNLGVLMQKELSINVVDEFILKLVDSGLEKVEHIAGVLGLEEDIIKNASVFLIKNELIRVESKAQSLQLTERGKGTLNGIKVNVPEKRGLSFFVNGITGQYSALESTQLYPAATIKNQRIPSLHFNKDIQVPSEESIEYSGLEKFLREMHNKGYSVPKGTLHDITEVEKVFTMFIKLRVLTYHEIKTDNYKYVVFDRDTRAFEYDRFLINLDREEHIGILPIEQRQPEIDTTSTISLSESTINEAHSNLDELKKFETRLAQYSQESKSATLSKTARQDLLSEIEGMKKQIEDLKTSTRLLRTFEHRPIMEKCFVSSKRWVIVVSPWLAPDAFDDDLMARMEKTLQRGVKVYILFGYPQELSEKKKRDEKVVLDKLKKINSKKYGKLLFYKNIGVTHEKVLISDKSFIVVGSFNWLSFRGSAFRGLRLEKSVYTENKNVIIDALNDVIQYGGLGQSTFE